MRNTKRLITIEGNLAYVPLTQGRKAVIDAADVHLVGGRNWYAVRIGRSVYATTKTHEPDGKRVTIHMHRLLTGFPVTDHIDGDGLNNKRANLREASHAENMRNRRPNLNNTSGYKGVCWDKRSQCWRAQIARSGEKIHLGGFHTPEGAHAAYCEASKRLHGEFGRTK